MSKITVVIEYESESDIPAFGSDTKALGGKVIAVQFEDVLNNDESGNKRGDN